MIEIKNVSKIFIKKDSSNKTTKFYADNDVSFNVNEGEIVGLLGPNGAGKTTLLRIISGIMKPSNGEVLIDNMKYDKNEIDIKKNIAFLTGNTKLYKDISPLELMNMCASYYDLSKEVTKSNIDNIINRFNMKEFVNQRISQLSTGQYQRVCIARCTIHNPKYYIFDEPTSGLDIISSKVILDFIKEEKEKGKSFIYSTHYMEEAENICDRVVLINKGKVITIGTPNDIKERTNTTNLRDAFFKLIGDDNEY